MEQFLSSLTAHLSESDRERLLAVHAPRTVAIPPEDSRRAVVVMPDGEIRAYGVTGKTEPFGTGRQVYLSSGNCGLDWRLVTPDGRTMGAATYLPWCARWVTVCSDGAGTYALTSAIGPDDTSPTRIPITTDRLIDMFQPEFYQREEGWRIVCCGHTSRDDWDMPVFVYSDDDGDTWNTVCLSSTPRHEAVYPHLGVRWQNTGTESTFTRLADGRLMLLVRTSLDWLYVYYSADLGTTWTDGEPSPFHCTLTTPYLLRLSDGRTVLFWNNTRPLAERNHETEFPPLSMGTILGYGEDVFTNRDACHAAIADDGDCTRWRGFRELALNEIRNAPDFRVHGGKLSSADKSVHQFQAIELPHGRILVSYGQHASSRRLAIFSVDWLYESERTEDWQEGLCHVSTQLYVKSVSGCHLDTAFAGHCAWNRTNGALLVPDPDATFGEVLQLCRIRDERLVSDMQGMVWNFPAAAAGTLTLEIRVEGSGAAIRLCDHWMNPSDPDVFRYALYDFTLDGRVLSPGVWHTVTVTFAADGTGLVRADGRTLFAIRRNGPAPQGISYLHMQTTAEATDPRGTLIRRMAFHAE